MESSVFQNRDFASIFIRVWHGNPDKANISELYTALTILCEYEHSWSTLWVQYKNSKALDQ